MDRGNRNSCRKEKNRCKKYDSDIGNLEWLKTPPALEGYTHSYQSYPCLFSPQNINLSNIAEISSRRNRLMEFLGSNGISTRPANSCRSIRSSFTKNNMASSPEDLPKRIYMRMNAVSLFHFFNGMSESEINYVVEKTRIFLHNVRVLLDDTDFSGKPTSPRGD